MTSGCTLTGDFEWHAVHTVDTIVDHVRGRVHVFIVAKRTIIEANAHFLSTVMRGVKIGI